MRAFRFEIRLDLAMESGADWEEMAAQYERPPEEWEWYRQQPLVEERRRRYAEEFRRRLIRHYEDWGAQGLGNPDSKVDEVRFRKS